MRDLERKLLSQIEPISFAVLRVIINGTSDAIFVKDNKFRYLLINEAGAKFIGRPVSQIIGKSDLELLPAGTGSQWLISDKKVLDTGETLSYEDTEEIDGVVRTFHTTKSAYRDDRGVILGLLGIARDISERQRAEAERERLINELKDALNEIKILKQTLPICMHCRKIRDDEGAWTELEAYIRAHTNSAFSHGLCQDCYQKNYPSTYAKKHPEEKT
jgi:PAS domain S-box-containing protein